MKIPSVFLMPPLGYRLMNSLVLIQVTYFSHTMTHSSQTSRWTTLTQTSPWRALPRPFPLLFPQAAPPSTPRASTTLWKRMKEPPPVMLTVPTQA
jgi:hypothetical protein